MSEHDNILTVKMIKKDGRLVFFEPASASFYSDFEKNLEEGQKVMMFLEAYKDTGYNLQIAKLKVSIRKLAIEIGYTFSEVELIIKEKSGLIYGNQIKSFGDCSVEELGLAIEALNELAEKVNMHFNFDLS